MKKQLKFRGVKSVTRNDLADPFLDIPYEEKLIMAGAIDLTNNAKIEYLPNGKVVIKPLDSSKLVQRGLFNFEKLNED